MIEEHGAADDVEHIVGVIVEEAEAVARAVGFVVGQHGVPQAAGFPNDGQGAIAQGNHLAQAAGLKLRGHEEHVRAGVNAVGQRAVHLEAGGYPAGVLLLGPAEQVHILGIAHAQHHQLHVFIHDFADDPVHQVQALLIAQAADDGDDGRFRLHIQAQFHLQGALAFGLAAQIVHRVTGGNEGIVFGVVLHHVDAVEHAGQVVPLGAEQAVHSFAVVRGLDFFGVGGADGGDLIGIYQAGLHEVGAAVAFQLVVGEIFIVQGQHVLHVLDAENALILQVVNGEHRADAREEGQLSILDAQQGGNHAALPVVGVDDVRLEAQQGQRVEYPAAEEAEAFMLVAAHAVNVAAAKVILVVHKVEDYAVIFQRFDAAVLLAPAQVHLKVQFMLHLIGIFFGDGAVKGQDDPHIVSLGGQHGRKGAHHVGQAAGFYKRDAFGGRKQDFHSFFTS